MDDDQAWVASGMERAAAALDGIAERIRDEDFDSLTQRAADYTRREPVVVLTGAAVAGFLLARFMKSSSHRHRHESVRRHPQTGGTDSHSGGSRHG